MACRLHSGDGAIEFKPKQQDAMNSFGVRFHSGGGIIQRVESSSSSSSSSSSNPCRVERQINFRIVSSTIASATDFEDEDENEDEDEGRDVFAMSSKHI